MIDEACFPEGTVIKVKGKEIGEVYPCSLGWGFHCYGTDIGGEGLDSKADALTCLREDHASYLSGLKSKYKSISEEYKEAFN